MEIVGLLRLRSRIPELSCSRPQVFVHASQGGAAGRLIWSRVALNYIYHKSCGQFVASFCNHGHFSALQIAVSYPLSPRRQSHGRAINRPVERIPHPASDRVTVIDPQ